MTRADELLQELADRLTGHEDYAADNACYRLWKHLIHDGLTPDWHQHPNATTYYRDFVRRLGLD